MRISSFSWLALALLATSFLVAGCLQPASVDRCQGSSDRNGCLTFYATWYQEPETCYYITDMPARQGCLNSSTDSIASQRLQDNYAAYGRTPIVRKPVVTNNSNKTTPAKNTTPIQAIPVVITPDAQVAKCVKSTPKSTNDTCAKQLATDLHDLTYCARIVSPDLRSACILSVATNLKDVRACDVFNITTDRQFCVYYSRGN